MNRKLQIANLFGVVALVALCAVQWRQNRRLNLGRNDLEKVRQAQEQKITEQEKALRGTQDDLARFKEQFTTAKSGWTEVKQKLSEAEQGFAQVRGERDQLERTLTNWMNAVTERDAKLKAANEQLTEMGRQLNESIQKFNQLVTNHNDIVARYNELGEKKPTVTK